MRGAVSAVAIAERFLSFFMTSLNVGIRPTRKSAVFFRDVVLDIPFSLQLMFKTTIHVALAACKPFHLSARFATAANSLLSCVFVISLAQSKGNAKQPRLLMHNDEFRKRHTPSACPAAVETQKREHRAKEENNLTTRLGRW
jgi:hypothetical protein